MFIEKIVVLAFFLSLVESIEWNGNWAMGCDFTGNDLSSANVPGPQCSGRCVSTPGCTHFAWTTYNGGTCWMKKGPVSKSDAFASDDKTMVCGVIRSQLGPPLDRGKLIWSDEFDSMNGFNRRWNLEVGGHGWGNNEAQFYTKNNHYIENGELVIEARKENYEGRSYTSARLRSQNSFKYGIFEFRAKVPTGRGTWPAIWMLPSKNGAQWPLDGEIDILENVGWDPNVIHCTIHCMKYNHGKNSHKSGSVYIQDVFKNYHTYTLSWTSTYIQVFVDGVEVFYYPKEDNSYDSWPFDNSLNVLLNLAIGGNWGGVKGIDDSIFPSRFRIDYVRVYKHGFEQPNITWAGNQANGCDFRGNDFKSVNSTRTRCARKCARSSKCTHFAWTTYNDGTCWMKKGPVNKSDAISTDDKTMACGIV